MPPFGAYTDEAGHRFRRRRTLRVMG
jgi:hypothetical protein